MLHIKMLLFMNWIVAHDLNAHSTALRSASAVVLKKIQQVDSVGWGYGGRGGVGVAGGNCFFLYCYITYSSIVCT